MQHVLVLGKTIRTVDVEQSELEKILSIKDDITSIYELLIQYSLFCKSLSDFKKDMYLKCIDMAEESSKDSFNSSLAFIQAENSVMHISASFIKFTSLLPALLAKALPENQEISGWAKKSINGMYDTPDGRYLLLCELRNAIAHNKVAITVSTGFSRKLLEPDGILTIGYFLSLDKFIDESMDKANKKSKLQNVKDRLCNQKGNVDLVKLFSDVAGIIYSELISPKTSELKAVFSRKKKLYIDSLVSNEILLPDEVYSSHVEYGEKLLYSANVLNRAENLMENIEQPIKATSVTIAPSLVR